ncbi:alpha-2-macroglobulin family protein [Lacinutrix salivirga]
MMKNYLYILMIFLTTTLQAQNNNYSELWNTVENFEKKGLPKSALEVVETLSSKAKADKNDAQQIKALLYKSKYALTLEEDAQLKVINDFKAEIEISAVPTKNVLQNLLANLYWQYFNQNRYKFYNRTKTEDKVDTEDFRTWDLQTLFNEVHQHYQASLENGLVLQQTNLEAFDAIINKQKDSRIYRPTLYDLLAHNALTFYKTTENSITQPAYKFKIDDTKYLSDAQTFSRIKITSKDENSLQLNALHLYQELIKFHLKDKSPFALADVNIERLNFVKENATFSNKENTLLKALQSEVNTHKNHEVSGLYSYEIANIYAQQGNNFVPNTNSENRWKLKEALEICNTIISKYPKSRGAEKCEALKSQILMESLQISTEGNLPIQQWSKLLINYKNINSINFKIAKVSVNDLKTLRSKHRQEEQLEFLQQLNALHAFKTDLKNENDYQKHSTEIVIPKLDNGHYILFGKVNNTRNSFAYQDIQVTNLAYIQKEENKAINYQIINRNNGKPIANAKVKVSYKKNNQNSFKTESFTTNQKGEFSIAKVDYRRNFLSLNITAPNDEALFDNLYLNRYYNYNQNEERTQYRGFLFTDRSIYRPGQTLYFKGITMKTFDNKSEVLNGQPVTVTLYNVNGEDVGSLDLKTNDYGSVAGEFILPNNGLTGNYSIQLTGQYNVNAYQSFSVEEYKRPKFEAKFNPVTETYKVNDSILVNGNALAYAGSNITDAKVVYRVHRKVQYPSWYYWYRPYFNSEPQEITHGETTTNAKGEFDITFKALPDDSVDKTTLPIFKYEVTADITDVNGETRSATTIVYVGYHALLATVSIDSKVDKESKDNTLTIDTKNLNGEFVPAKGTIKIYKLNAPNTVLRPRPWQAPDYQVIPKEEFSTKFPHEAYSNEHNSLLWKKGEEVFSKTFNTEKSKTLKLGNIKRWESGNYVVVLESKDKFGQLVKDEARPFLYSDKDKTLADNQLFSITTNKSEYKTNETVELTIGSAAKNLVVTIDVEKAHKTIRTEIITLNNNKKTITIPVSSEDLGGFVVHYSYAFNNSFAASSLPITVPYPKTDLEIETLTFRDKLQPGTDETWRFKIKGPKGDKVAAELLASMYDASLDQFKTHDWTFTPIQRPYYYSRIRRNAGQSFNAQGFRIQNLYNNYRNYAPQYFDGINMFGLYFGGGNLNYRFKRMSAGIEVVADEMELEESIVMESKIAAAPAATNASGNEDSSGILGLLNVEGDNSTNEPGSPKKADFSGVTIRKNLQETAFFFPQLQTDNEGHISFSFTTPEALTKWKLQVLAHTKTLESAVTSLETVTQKELMVIPNAPRFLREGDQISISTKIANLTDKALKGVAVLQLFDGLTGKPIDEKLSNAYNELGFSAAAKGNTQVTWNLDIPFDVEAIQYKIIAKAGDFSDGEQNALPVLTNRMLVTETLPMWIKSNETRTFTLDKLKTTNSSTLKHHKLTLEITSNPAWYAVQALPYLMEYPYECNEQTFSRYYANALASHIANSNPRIQEVFNQWKNTDALLSNLEKNQDLKSILIQETPWLRDAQSETEQKKRIALLFDLNKMTNELQNAKRKLKNNQMSNGAWPWFNGGRANRYITQHIITGFGHLDKLNVTSSAVETSSMIEKAIAYLDAEFVQEYKDIRKYNKNVDLSKDHLSYTQLHYLYMRSFYPEIKQSKQVQEITDYYQTQIQKYWLSRSLYAKGMMALVTNRMNDKTTASNILKSLKETSITNEELGMYWKENTSSWYWYQAPIETHALLIEAFAEVGTVIHSEAKNLEDIDNLKIWLLKNKQTNRWKTTKATTEAVYALLLQGSDWLSVTDRVDVVIGGQQISPSKLEDVKVEAGTGYYKTAWNPAKITPEMATVKLTKKGKGIAWGSLYWQYFEDLDKITSAETPLKLKKKLFLKTNTDTGEEISEITTETQLNVGDLVRVRIELRSDRNMEFIHMKDMRAAGLEPVNVISQYKWQDGLGYYESTKDASTNFFFDYLPKGVYVFEYDLRVNNAGNMSNGITTIQSMYAPEFSSHSEGVRITVE